MKLNQLTIKQSHDGLIAGDFSSEEITKACLDQIDEFNPDLNAFITVCHDEAMAMAKEADKKIKAGDNVHYLTGVPFSIKDAICTKGIRSTGGAKILDNYVPPYDSTCIKKIRDLGGVIVGKTNCDAFGHGASNENSDYGPVRNPWDTSKVSGGSSGGSAVSVAADQCIYSIGEDTGGSIRQPAAFNSIAGLKVSYGRNSRFGIMPMASSLDTLGPMAKNVEDLAIILEVIAGHDPMDSTTVKNKVPKYTKLIGKDIKGLKIGLPKEYFEQIEDEETKVAVEKAVEKYKELGCKVKEVSLPHTKYAIAVYYIVVPSEDSANLARLDGMRYGMRYKEAKDLMSTYLQSRSKGFPDEVKRRIMIGTYALSAGYYDAYYLKAQKVRTLIKNEFDKVFTEVDFLVTPTSPFPPFGIGEKVDDIIQMYLADAMVCPASVAGINAISIPCGFSNKLPVGLQIIGPRLQEELVLQVAYAYEQETEWHKRKSTKNQITSTK